MFNALETTGVSYAFLENTRDIWVRDFMPVKTASGRLVQFRYEPSYLVTRKDKKLRSVPAEVCSANGIKPDVISDINLDGGNVVFSPSRSKAIISNRVFAENQDRDVKDLIDELERLLEAQIIFIPSFPEKDDMTGHADGMARFVSEHIVAVNDTDDAFEEKIKASLAKHNIKAIDFPFLDPNDENGDGCYINYLETEEYVFLPMFGEKTNEEAVASAGKILKKQIVPVDVKKIIKAGGMLNCISWEQD